MRKITSATLLSLFIQSLSAFSMGASKLGGRVADVGWKFTEVASSKVQEVSGTVRNSILGTLSFYFELRGLILIE